MLFLSLSKVLRQSIPLLSTLFLLTPLDAEKFKIHAVGIPLADHYAGIVAYEKYKNKMMHAEYSLEILPGPDLVRRHFRSFKETDLAFIVSPMVMDMYAKNPDFKWVGLMHRDGNALAINSRLNKFVKIDPKDSAKKRQEKVIHAIEGFKESGHDFGGFEVAVPSLLATHSTIFYKFLKDNGLKFSLQKNEGFIHLRIIKPPRSTSYMKTQNIYGKLSATEQSLPWPNIIETNGDGCIVWYSKDILKHPKGHVECIIIAKNETIEKKKIALQEVLYYIHKAGIDIEKARMKGGHDFDEIVKMVRKHIPSHTAKSIKTSLDRDTMGINFKNLNVDENAKESFREIMDLAHEAGFIKKKIDIEALASDEFHTQITESLNHE